MNFDENPAVKQSKVQNSVESGGEEANSVKNSAEGPSSHDVVMAVQDEGIEALVECVSAQAGKKLTISEYRSRFPVKEREAVLRQQETPAMEIDVVAQSQPKPPAIEVQVDASRRSSLDEEEEFSDEDEHLRLRKNMLSAQERYNRCARDVDFLRRELRAPQPEGAKARIEQELQEAVESLKESREASRSFSDAYAAECAAFGRRVSGYAPADKPEDRLLDPRYKWIEIPHEYPRFDIHSEDFNVVKYLRDFEQYVDRKGALPCQYGFLLKSVVDKRDVSVEQFITQWLDHPWEDLKQMVKSRFHSRSMKAEALRKLDAARQGNEPIGRYADHFLSLMQAAEVREDDAACLKFSQSLNADCKKLLYMAQGFAPEPKSIAEVKELVEISLQRASAIGLKAFPELGDAQRPKRSSEEYNGFAKRKFVGETAAAKASEERSCWICGKTGHYKSDCPKKKEKKNEVKQVKQVKPRFNKSFNSPYLSVKCVKSEENLDGLYDDLWAGIDPARIFMEDRRIK